MMTRRPWFVALLAIAGGLIGPARSAEPIGIGRTATPEVVVVFNQNLPESRAVAEHYASRRGVPAEQLIGLDLPSEETISRRDYLERLEKPLLARLESLKLITFGAATNRGADGRTFRQVISERIRYAALCYGVPVRILRDESLIEPGDDKIVPTMRRRNEAAVDSQLAIAPLADRRFPWTGPLVNPFQNMTNAALFRPSNGLLMVTRLDGPTPAIATALVDQAMAAETNGLWGRAYFDARGLATNNDYFGGDVIIKSAANVLRRVGFETVLDEKPETFSAGYPMSQIAFYAGWYDQTVSGPFTRPKVEFMPGAFAYHLYSFGASTIRGSNTWVGRLLATGVTVTMGAVDEPYLSETPNISQFVYAWTVLGFSYGEAAYAAQPSVSWQTTVIGDPLYRPFGRGPNELLTELGKRNAQLLEWYFLVAVNQRLVAGVPADQAIRELTMFPATRRSAVLTEKMADLYSARGSLTDALDTYEVALRRGPSPIQRQRLLLSAAERRAVAGPEDAALAHYQTFLQENLDHPDRLPIYRAMLAVANRGQLTNAITRIEAEIKKLSPSP